MNTEIMNKLDALIKAWVKDKHNSTNPTGTYTDETITEFLQTIASWSYQWYCEEDQENIKGLQDRDYEEWVEENIDRLAEEDLEYQVSLRGVQSYKKHKLN